MQGFVYYTQSLNYDKKKMYLDTCSTFA